MYLIFMLIENVIGTINSNSLRIGRLYGNEVKGWWCEGGPKGRNSV
jgi:hypothetical protein